MKRPIFKTYKKENKELTSTLKEINTNPDLKCIMIKDFLDTFELLGYNTNSELLYAVVEKDIWKWQTTKNKRYITKTWNTKKEIYEYQKKPYDLSDHILKHVYPLELKNSVSKNKYIKNIKDAKGANYIDSDMCGSELKEKSNILIIDVDCHDTNSLQTHNELHMLINHFQNEYLYLEKSYEGSYHLFVKLDKEYSTSEKKQYINTLIKEYNLKCIEIPTRMRFPFSYHYEPYTHEYETLTPGESIIKIKEKYKSHKGFKIPQKIPTTKVVPIVSKLYARKKQYTIKHQTPTEFLKNTNLIISRNNRHYPMLEICRISKYNNWTDEETLNIIKQIDTGSKDLKKWSDNTLLEKIQYIKSKSTIYCNHEINKKPEKFISNIPLLSTNIKHILSDYYLIDKIITNCKYKITNLNREKFKICLLEMFGAILYDTENNRITLNKKSEKYLIGKQFSETYCLKLKDHYKNNFNSFDTHNIIKSILKHSSLFKQYYSNQKGWYFNNLNKENNFCNQYDFINNNTHIIYKHKNTVIYLIVLLLNIFYKKHNLFKLLIIQDFFTNFDYDFTLNSNKILDLCPDTG